MLAEKVIKIARAHGGLLKTYDLQRRIKALRRKREVTEKLLDRLCRRMDLEHVDLFVLGKRVFRGYKLFGHDVLEKVEGEAIFEWIDTAENWERNGLRGIRTAPATSIVIHVRLDNGKHWYFVDADVVTARASKALARIVRSYSFEIGGRRWVDVSWLAYAISVARQRWKSGMVTLSKLVQRHAVQREGVAYVSAKLAALVIGVSETSVSYTTKRHRGDIVKIGRRRFYNLVEVAMYRALKKGGKKSLLMRRMSADWRDGSL